MTQKFLHFQCINGDNMRAFNCATPHTSHCLASGDIMVSIMGDPKGAGRGNFVLIDGDSMEIKGLWAEKDNEAKFGYDFWYQPYFDVMVSSEWGAPRSFKDGFLPEKTTDWGRSTFHRCINYTNCTIKGVFFLRWVWKITEFLLVEGPKINPDNRFRRRRNCSFRSQVSAQPKVTPGIRWMCLARQCLQVNCFYKNLRMITRYVLLNYLFFSPGFFRNQMELGVPKRQSTCHRKK